MVQAGIWGVGLTCCVVVCSIHFCCCTKTWSCRDIPQSARAGEEASFFITSCDEFGNDRLSGMDAALFSFSAAGEVKYVSIFLQAV